MGKVEFWVRVMIMVRIKVGITNRMTVRGLNRTRTEAHKHYNNLNSKDNSLLTQKIVFTAVAALDTV